MWRRRRTRCAAVNPVAAASTTTVYIKLSVATISESVIVSGESPLVEVAKAQPSSVIVGEHLAVLPVLDRNFLVLAQLLPGAAPLTRGGPEPDRHPAQPQRGGVEVAAVGCAVERRFRAISGGPLAVTAGIDLDGDLNTQNDRPVGLPITVGRGDVDDQLANINAFRATRNQGPVAAELVEPDPIIGVDVPDAGV